MSAQVINLAAWREAHRPEPSPLHLPRPRQPIIDRYGLIVLSVIAGFWGAVALLIVWARSY